MSNAMLRLIIALAIAVLSFSVVAQDEPKRSISNVAGDVYRFQNNFHAGLLVLTEEGVVVTDPINADAAEWLKKELATMTDKPITHLIYSHSHLDHASGGAVLAETAMVIAHANAPDSIDGVTPDLRFTDSKQLQIGSKTIELTWLGVGHAEDLIAVVVRPENVAFITDASSPKRLPWQDMGGADIDGWINQIRKIEALDFEIFAPAHGNIGVKADAHDTRVYMEQLRTEVLDGLNAGKSVDTLVSQITLDAYKDWQQYDTWREPNIRGMAKFLKDNDKL